MKSAGLLQICIVAASFAASLQVSAQEWAGVYPSKGCVPRAVDTKEADYRSWIKPYAQRSRKSAGSQKQDLELSLTISDGDNLAPDPSSGTSLLAGNWCQMTTTYSLSSSGIASMTRITPLAVQGGGPDRLSAEELPTIQKLIRDLLLHPPDDHAVLPPPGRRLVLCVQGDNKTVARVYDRADIPSSVMQVLGLVGATSGPLWMEFKPTVSKKTELAEPSISAGALGVRVRHPRDPATNGLQPDTVTLAVSPDSAMIVTRYFYINARTVVTYRGGASILLTVPESELDRREIYVFRAFFTPNSRFLLLLSNLPAMYIYDTETWKSVTSLPGLPSGVTAFYPSADWRQGVGVLRSGEAQAWDVSKGQKQSDLDLQGDLQDVSFSEDDSLFAVSSVHSNEDFSSTFRLRVWDTSKGRFVREVIPPYYYEHDVLSRPIWWGHGKYLLANVRAGHWGAYMIAVWNVQSGQLRAGFSACDSSQDPYEVGIDGNRLLKWCFDETLLVWNIPAAIDKITEFEDSLNRIR